MKSFPYYKQLDQMDCGPTCLLMITKYYGKTYSLSKLREKSYITREGVSLLGISNAAEEIGLRTLAVTLTYEQLIKERPFPCIIHWENNHFVVVYKERKKRLYIADPAQGLKICSEKDFLNGWSENTTVEKDNSKSKGIALILEPTNLFYDSEEQINSPVSIKFLWVYFYKFRALFGQLMIGLLAGTIIQLIFPFLTQAIVDVGINQKNVSFLYIVLFAQIILYFSQTGITILRSWILLHISTRINISLISNFLMKLMSLPISYFETKTTGDLMQRVNDHQRIESFLTSTTLSTLFSIINLFVFSFILIQYNIQIFTVYALGSFMYMLWIWIFLKTRRELDYKNFSLASSNQNSLIQLITGIQEIKLHNAEKKLRWGWESIQASIFKLSLRNLTLNQIQSTGANSINEFKNLIITFLVAKAVIDGQMTLGMMMSVQYIIGSLNGPIFQFIGFIQGAQDAKISLERIQEIHGNVGENDDDKENLTVFPTDKSIRLVNVNFGYEGLKGMLVLKNINLIIPEGKVTAIVGTSGSGKTTLMKLLLRFYTPLEGEINLGNSNINLYQNRLWREKCGSVFQDGFIFSDTIARNIAIAEDSPNQNRLENAVRTANINEYIDSLPLGFNTKIGADGNGLSQGQKQRILIARAIYRNPEYLFFDEATNALDANNERAIVENLDTFFKNKTVVIIAHRLSTVQKADNIVVLENGQVVEMGTHLELIKSRGAYFKLVKNQLELGD